jgi:hypothetical protein
MLTIAAVNAGGTTARPAVSKPNITLASAAPDRANPTKSNFPRGGSRASWMNNVTSTLSHS